MGRTIQTAKKKNKKVKGKGKKASSSSSRGRGGFGRGRGRGRSSGRRFKAFAGTKKKKKVIDAPKDDNNNDVGNSAPAALSASGSARDAVSGDLNSSSSNTLNRGTPGDSEFHSKVQQGGLVLETDEPEEEGYLDESEAFASRRRGGSVDYAAASSVGGGDDAHSQFGYETGDDHHQGILEEDDPMLQVGASGSNILVGNAVRTWPAHRRRPRPNLASEEAASRARKRFKDSGGEKNSSTNMGSVATATSTSTSVVASGAVPGGSTGGGDGTDTNAMDATTAIDARRKRSSAFFDESGKPIHISKLPIKSFLYNMPNARPMKSAALSLKGKSKTGKSKSKSSKRKKKGAAASASENESQQTQKTHRTPQNDATTTGEESAAAKPLAPTVRLDEDGNIVINQDSLRYAPPVVSSTSQKISDTTGRSRHTTSSTYANRVATRAWTEAETLKFYRSLRTYGTDFTMMLNAFPGKKRSQLKSKYIKETKLQPKLVDMALNPRIALPSEISDVAVTVSSSKDATADAPSPKKKTKKAAPAATKKTKVNAKEKAKPKANAKAKARVRRIGEAATSSSMRRTRSTSRSGTVNV